MDIFHGPNRLFGSVIDAESYDIKILSQFPGNPSLEILIENCKCVGGTNVRGCFLIKVYLIAIYNCPMILGYFLM